MNNTDINETYKSQQKASLAAFLIDFPDSVFLALVSFFSGSFIVALDAFESFSNAVQDGLSFILSKVMLKDSRFKYDYGRGKIDAFGSLIASVVMYIGIVCILIGAVHGLIFPRAPGGVIFFAILIKISHIIFDIYLLRKQLKVAKTGNSALVKSAVILQKKSLIFDAILFFAVTIMFFFREFSYIVYFEPIVCILCAAYIGLQNTQQLKSAVSDLLDKTLDEETQMKILKCFSTIYPQIKEFTGIRTRRSGHIIYIDLLVSFDDNVTYNEIRSAFDTFKHELSENIPDFKLAVIIGE